MKLSRLFILSVSLLVFLSCGKSPEYIQDEAILKAQYLLSSKSCDEAVKTLEAIPYNNSNARYLKTLSSAYACKAGYSTIKFFADDIDNTVSPSPVGGMTTYSTSLATTSQSITVDNGFKNLVKAVDILLYAGGLDQSEDPTIALRAQHFSPKVLADMHNQITFMMLAELGRYMKIYGNTNSSGFKGMGGPGGPGNTCFTSYNQSDNYVKIYLDTNSTGSCSFATGTSHPDLAQGAINRREKLCRGVTIFNNVIDLLPVVIAGSAGQTTALTAFTDAIDVIKSVFILAIPGIGETMKVTSYERCLVDPDINEAQLENTFAAYFESMVL